MKKITRWIKILSIPAIIAVAAFVFLTPHADQNKQKADAHYDSNWSMRHNQYRRWFTYAPTTSNYNVLGATSYNYPYYNKYHNQNLPAYTTVAIQNESYAPSTITVQAGATVTWVNNDPVAHTVTSDNGSFDSGLMQPGALFQVTFPYPGTYTYHCNIHPEMHGTIVVQPTVGASYSNVLSNQYYNNYTPTSYYSPYTSPYNQVLGAQDYYSSYSYPYNQVLGDQSFNYSPYYSGNSYHNQYYNTSSYVPYANTYNLYSPSTGNSVKVIVP